MPQSQHQIPSLEVGRHYWVKERFVQLRQRIGDRCVFEGGDAGDELEITLATLQGLAQVRRFVDVPNQEFTAQVIEEKMLRGIKTIFVFGDRRLIWVPGSKASRQGAYSLQQLNDAGTVVAQHVLGSGKLNKSALKGFENVVWQWLGLPALSMDTYYKQGQPVEFVLIQDSASSMENNKSDSTKEQ